MDMGGHMVIATEDLLTLVQWMSPSFPIGAFAYSNGLETDIENGRVNSLSTLADWIETSVRFGSGYSDALFLAAAYHADLSDIVGIDARNRAFGASRERRMESDLQGAAFCQAVCKIWGLPLEALTYPIAVGAAAQLRGLPLIDTSALFLQAYVGNLAAVAMRLVPLGQTEGQQVISQSISLCRETANDTAHGDLEQLSSTGFLADIASMQHETLHSRIFRT